MTTRPQQQQQQQDKKLDEGLAAVGLLASPVIVDRTGSITKEERVETMRRVIKERKKEETIAKKELERKGSETLKEAKAKTGYAPRRTRRRGKHTKVISGIKDDGDGDDFGEVDEDEEEDESEGIKRFKDEYGVMVSEILGNQESLERFAWKVMFDLMTKQEMSLDDALIAALTFY